MKKQHLVQALNDKIVWLLCGRIVNKPIPNWKRWPLCKNCKKVARSRT